MFKISLKFFMVLALLSVVFQGCDMAQGDDKESNSVVITFESNNEAATGTMEKQKVTKGETVTLSANSFSLSGITFSSWNTEADGSGDKYLDKAEIENLTASLTLYAQWTAYTVSFDKNNTAAQGTVESVVAEIGTPVTLTANGFTLADYDFKEWNTVADGSGVSYRNGQQVTGIEVNTVLYAQWEETEVAPLPDLLKMVGVSLPGLSLYVDTNSDTIKAIDSIKPADYSSERITDITSYAFADYDTAFVTIRGKVYKLDLNTFYAMDYVDTTHAEIRGTTFGAVYEKGALYLLANETGASTLTRIYRITEDRADNNALVIKAVTIVDGTAYEGGITIDGNNFIIGTNNPAEILVVNRRELDFDDAINIYDTSLTQVLPLTATRVNDLGETVAANMGATRSIVTLGAKTYILDDNNDIYEISYVVEDPANSDNDKALEVYVSETGYELVALGYDSIPQVAPVQ